MKNFIRTTRILLIIFGLIALTVRANAATDTWTGGATPNGNWSAGANWLSGNAPSPSDSLVFTNQTGVTEMTTNDFTAGTAFDGITFGTSSAGSTFSLNGNGILLSGQTNDLTLGVTNTASLAETVNLNLTNDWGCYKFASPAGSLNLNGIFTNSLGGVAYFGPNNVSSISLTTNYAGLISGIGGAGLIMNGTGLFTNLATISGGVITAYNYATDPHAQILSGAGTITSNPSNNVLLSASTVQTYTLAATTYANTIFASSATASNTIATASGKNLIMGQIGGIYASLAGGTSTIKTPILVNGAGYLSAGGNTAGSGILVFGVGGGNNTGNQVNINQTGGIVDNPLGGAVTVIEVGSGSMVIGSPGSYSGGTYVCQNGFLQGNNQNAGPTTMTPFGYGPVYIASGATIYPNVNGKSVAAGSITLSNNMYLSPGLGYSGSLGDIKAGNETFSGTITLLGTNANGVAGAGDRIAETVNTTTPPLTFSGQITGGGTLELNSQVATANSLFSNITANANNWTGGLIIDNTGANSSFVKLGTNNQLASNNVALVQSSTGTARLDLNGFSDTIGGLSGSVNTLNQVANFGAAPSIFTLGANNASATFGGVIGGDSSPNTLSIIKSGSGTETLSGMNTFAGTATIIGGKLAFTGANTYSGNTFVLGGTLSLSGSGSINSSPSITVSNATLDVSAASAFAYPNSISLTNGAFNVGNIFATVGGNLAISNSTLIFPANLSSAAVTVTGTLITGGTTNVVNVTSLPAVSSYPVQMTLIKYGSPDPNLVDINNKLTTLGVSLPTLGNPVGYLTNNMANNSIDLVLTSGPVPAVPLTWSGQTNGVNIGNWDILITSNWLSTAGGAPYFYQDGSVVTFDDTAIGTTSVNLTSTLLPSSITVSNASKTYTFSGSGKISGTASLTKTNTGTLIIDNTGVNDYSGGNIINGGTVQVGNNDANGNLSGNITDNGTLVFDRTNSTANIAGIISGTGILVSEGAGGTLTLSGADTYAGTTTVVGGTLALSSSGSINNSSSILLSNATFNVSAASLYTGTNSIVITNGTFNLGTNRANSLTSLAISNSTLICAASLTAPSVTLAGALTTGGSTNTIIITSVPGFGSYPTNIPLIKYTIADSGITNINNVLTTLGLNGSLPGDYLTNDTANSSIDLVLTSGNGPQQYLDVNNSTAGFGNPNGGSYNQTGSTWTTDSTGSSATTTFTSGDSMVFGAVPGDTTLQGTFTVALDQGTGQVLDGILVNSTGLNITLINNANVHPTASTTWMVNSGSTLTESDTRQSPGGLNFNKNVVTLIGGGTINFGTAIGPNDGNAGNGFIENMSLGGTVNIYETNLAVGYTSTYDGSYTLTAGILNFASAQSAGSFSGFTSANNSLFNINGGTIDNTSGSALTLSLGSGGYSLGGNFTFAGTTNLNFSTAPVTLIGSRQITVSSNTLTIGGVISDGSSGYGITKAGSGTLALSGANTYSGATTVNAGKLITTTASTGAGSYTVADNATLDVQVAAGGQSLIVPSLTLGSSSGCTLQIDTSSLGNPSATVINDAGALTVNGTVTVNLFGTALTAGTFTILTYTGTHTGSFNLVASPRFNATLHDDGVGNVTITLGTVDTGIVWIGNASGNWDINDSGNLTWIGNNSGTPTDYTESGAFGNDAVLFNDNATGTTTVNLTTTLSPSSFTMNNVNSNYVFTGTGKISGTVGLNMTGSGTATFAETGGDNFSGGITNASGTLILSNANANISGGITVNGGSLTDAHSGTISGGVTVNNGSFLDEHSGTIAGGLTVNLGTAVLDETGTISGNMTISGGTLQVGNNDGNGSLPSGTLADNAALVFDRTNSTLNVSNVISGGGTLANNGTGTVTLSAIETLTGAVTVNAGTLAVNETVNNTPDGISASSSLTINTNATFLFESDNGGFGTGSSGGPPVTINAGGTLTGLGSADGGDGTSSHIPSLLTLNGGTLAMQGPQTVIPSHGSWDLYGGVAVNSGPNYGVTSTISALGVIPTQSGGTHFDVTASPGGTPSGIDLLVSGSLIDGTAGGVFVGSGIILNPNSETGVMALDNNNTFLGGVTIDGGTLQLGTASDTNALTEPMGPGTVTINNAGSTLKFASSMGVTVTNVISDDNNSDALVLVSSGTNILIAANIYTAPTVISNGTLIVNGSLAAASTVTIGVNGTLSGIGTVGGNVTNSGTITPGTANTIGLLTCSGNVTNYGTSTSLMKLNKSVSPSNDVLAVTGNLAYGGKLTVTNMGPPLVSGDSFTLFNAGSSSGSFSATNLPALSAGLSWTNSGVTWSVTGTAATVTNLRITNFSLSGGTNLVISGTNAGSGTYYVLASTNVALPLASWTPIATNVLGGSGNFTLTATNAVNTASLKQQFYILSTTNN